VWMWRVPFIAGTLQAGLYVKADTPRQARAAAIKLAKETYRNRYSLGNPERLRPTHPEPYHLGVE